MNIVGNLPHNYKDLVTKICTMVIDANRSIWATSLIIKTFGNLFGSNLQWLKFLR